MLSDCGSCRRASITNTFTFFFTWQRIQSRSETVDIQYYATVGWPDRCCFLHTSPTHNTSSIPPLICSAAAGLALFPNNQDCTHNYSWQTQAVQSPPSHSLQLCTCCAAWLRYQEKLRTSPRICTIIILVVHYSVYIYFIFVKVTWMLHENVKMQTLDLYKVHCTSWHIQLINIIKPKEKKISKYKKDNMHFTAHYVKILLFRKHML